MHNDGSEMLFVKEEKFTQNNAYKLNGNYSKRIIISSAIHQHIYQNQIAIGDEFRILLKVGNGVAGNVSLVMTNL